MNSPAPWRRPESVLVLVYTAAADVLLLRRRQPFDFWQSVTGCLEPGETHAVAAARELAEETGIEADERLSFSGNQRIFEIDPRWRHRYAPDVRCNTEYEWRCRVAVRLPVRVDGREHTESCWLPIGEAIEAVWSWTNREALRELETEL